MRIKAQIMDEQGVSRALTRIAHEILEHNNGSGTIALLGIRTRGVPLAEKLAKEIEKIDKTVVDVGEVCINNFRDDLNRSERKAKALELPFSVENRDIILVDDVLFTGRTVRAAIEGVISVGRPKSIQLAVLIDRGHRELPIRADYLGKNIPTSKSEVVSVSVDSIDGKNCVLLYDLTV